MGQTLEDYKIRLKIYLFWPRKAEKKLGDIEESASPKARILQPSHGERKERVKSKSEHTEKSETLTRSTTRHWKSDERGRKNKRHERDQKGNEKPAGYASLMARQQGIKKIIKNAE